MLKSKLICLEQHTYTIPVAQVEFENPSGHAVHMFSSLTSQAVHVPPQAKNDHAGFSNIFIPHILHTCFTGRTRK